MNGIITDSAVGPKGNLLLLKCLCLEHLFGNGEALYQCERSLLKEETWKRLFTMRSDFAKGLGPVFQLNSGFKMLIQCGVCCNLLCLHNDSVVASSGLKSSHQKDTCGQITVIPFEVVVPTEFRILIQSCAVASGNCVLGCRCCFI